jgi:hypothetical protein
VSSGYNVLRTIVIYLSACFLLYPAHLSVIGVVVLRVALSDIFRRAGQVSAAPVVPSGVQRTDQDAQFTTHISTSQQAPPRI